MQGVLRQRVQAARGRLRHPSGAAARGCVTSRPSGSADSGAQQPLLRFRIVKLSRLERNGYKQGPALMPPQSRFAIGSQFRLEDPEGVVKLDNRSRNRTWFDVWILTISGQDTTFLVSKT